MADFQPSFIPKKTAKETRQVKRSKGMGVFLLLAVALFIIALVGSGGVFAYERLLMGGIEQKKVSLARAQEAFEPALIRELARLDDRLDTAAELLDRHSIVSNLFTLLENNTLATVRFLDFDFQLEEEGIAFTLAGEAQNFGSVVLQSEQFGKNRNFQDPIFSNLDVNADGNVTFDFSATIDPSLVSLGG